MSHPVIAKGNVAVITGGASGIGLAAAIAFARAGMKVCIADVDQARLQEAATRLSSVTAATHVMTFVVDVSRAESVKELEHAVGAHFGGTDILMNNAGIQPGSTLFGEPDNWQRIIAVNMWGIINGSRIFAPNMIARGKAGLIINTGSKQGITTPPGDPAYNVSKAGVKAFTEALQHELRNTEGCHITAHLLVPGFVFTGLTAKGRTEKPAGSLDARADRRLHDRAARGRRFLHPVPGQRRAPRPRRKAHALGRRRYRREPAPAVALAPGLCGRVREVREGGLGALSHSLSPFLRGEGGARGCLRKLRSELLKGFRKGWPWSRRDFCRCDSVPCPSPGSRRTMLRIAEGDPTSPRGRAGRG
ncbi:NAD(P)-dependent dehydrogenase (short-subunit alcohol dehydrogenase family) [Bradyrhizobium diazoefficiens]